MEQRRCRWRARTAISRQLNATSYGSAPKPTRPPVLRFTTTPPTRCTLKFPRTVTRGRDQSAHGSESLNMLSPSPSEVDGFFRDGFIILRDVIPPTLIRDLRRE